MERSIRFIIPVMVLTIAACTEDGAGIHSSAGAAPASVAQTYAAVEIPKAETLKRATQCHVDPYRFRTGMGTPVHMTTTSSDGGYCGTSPVYRSGGGFQGGATTPPKHGTTLVAVNKEGNNVFLYKPNPGYVGSDEMILSLNPGAASLDVTIDVVE